MLMRIVMAALIAGALAGTLVFAGHMWKTTPLILHAEVFENQGGAHTHGHEDPAAANKAAAAHDHGSHDHGGDGAFSPEDGFERNAFTLLSDIITAIGFAFILIGTMALSGRHVGWRSGMIWGLCGYAAFYLAPAVGLAPELPGMAAADLVSRQTWWLGTATATATALGLMFFAPGHLWKVAAVILLALPHIVGAPHPTGAHGSVPPELAAQFAVATLAITGLFWMALGSLGGYFFDRFGDTA